MKKKYILTGLTLLSYSFGVLAQTAAPALTELPPPIIETYGVPAGAAPINVAPAPESFAQNIPVGEPVEGATAKAGIPNSSSPGAPTSTPDDGSIKGLSMGLGVYPIGFNNQTIGVGAADETGRYFFGLKPTAGLAMAFLTDGGKKVTFSLGYNLDFQEYYNKDATSRFFGHTLESNIGVDWNSAVSTSVPVEFAYSFKSGADKAEDNSLGLTVIPGFKFKSSPQLSFDIKYMIAYTQGLRDVALSDVNTGGGGGSGDFVGADEFYDDDFDFTGQTGYGFTANGLSATSSSTIQPEDVLHHVILGTTYKPVDNTSLGLTYAYRINDFNTDDSGESSGHHVTPSIRQNLFKGNTVSLANEVRFLSFKYATVSDGSAKQTFRNRLQFTVAQEITKNMSFDMYYRWQLAGSNADNYEKLTPSHWFYMGMIFSL